MDNCDRSSYLRRMFGRIVALLVVLSFAVVTAMTAAHTARATLGEPVAGHSGHMMAAADSGDTACGASQPCSPDDAAACAAICAGLPGCIAPVSGNVFTGHVTAGQVLPAETIVHGHSPGLNEQPPKTRLL